MTGGLRLGIVATELVPEHGGMQRHARGTIAALSERAQVVVYTRRGQTLADAPCEVRTGLERRPAADLPVLRGEPVDAWLMLNAGHGQYAGQLGAPVFVYCHGNDFLMPYPDPGAAGRLAVAALRRAPVLWRSADATERSLRRRLVGRGLRKARHLFTNSGNSRSQLGSIYGLAEDGITVVPPGVDEVFFQDHPPATGGAIRLLTVSRLETISLRKNVDGVLRALAAVDDVPFRYTVVGDGDDRPRLEALARDLGLSDRVTFRGFATQAELLDAYRESDLFVLAARATSLDIEGFGIVFAEAGASGVPSLCSAAGGSVDAVADGVNGIVLPSAEPTAIASGIRRFAAERERFTPAAAQEFARQFRWQAVGRRMYDEIAARLDASPRRRQATLKAAPDAATGG